MPSELVLSADEREQLVQAEQVIEAGLQTFVEVGTELGRIRDQRLYREDFPTFDEYLRHRWGMARARAYQLMEAAAVVTGMSSMLDTPPELLPSNARQATELVGLEPEQAVQVMEAASVEGPPTAQEIRGARLLLVEAPEEPDDPDMDDHPNPDVAEDLARIKARKFAAHVNKVFANVYRGRTDYSAKRIAEVAAVDHGFETRLRKHLATTREWCDAIEQAIGPENGKLRRVK